ncbi:ATP-binding protein [Actinomycetospora cinnamomea]|uniref:ATP-binding protein n=1 Tax=Actinomycetospora cinnamomea TaxID=663609 RepID=UPI000E31AFF8|nr:AAA family ATPase [Actinomycetospora cinnamomea]
MTTAFLRLRLVGRFAVEGALDEPVPGGQAERLLCILAAHHGRFLPTAALTELLWEHQRPADPARNLAALVSRLRRSLGRRRIEGDPRAYRLVRDADTVVDVTEALDLVGTAERELAQGAHALAAMSAEVAEGLLAADVPLAGQPEATWVDEVREGVAGGLSRARACRRTAALELGDLDTAIDEASRTLAEDPLDEPACRALMQAQQRRGAHAAALAAYDRLRRHLADELGSDPSPATREVFLSALRQEPGASARSEAAVAPGPAEPGPLIGREVELAVLSRAWSAAVRGRGGLVLVTGEAGIGKSALSTALRIEARRSGGLVEVVRCSGAERSLYLQPLAELVRGVVLRLAPGAGELLAERDRAALADLVPEVAPRRAPVASPSELRRRRTLEAMAELFGEVAATRPLLLAIEDLEHAGERTVEALHFLATRLATRRVLILATERTSETPGATAPLRDVATHLELGALSRDALRTLLARAGREQDLERFASWTGGSPLLVSELLRHPESVTDGNGTVPAIPTSLQEALSRRLAATAEDVTLLLAQAAVLGTSFGLDDVAALTELGVEECAHRAGRAARAGFLVTDGGSYRFANDIVRRIAYESAPLPVRVSRHRRVAALLAGRPEAAAVHHAAAGDHAEAARSWLAAADAAHLVFAHAEAEKLLTAGVEEAHRAGDRALEAAALLRRGGVRCDLGRHEDACDDHDGALTIARELGDEELEARALEGLGWAALWARDALGAVDLAERAGHLAESAVAAPGARRSSLLLLGRVRHWDGDYTGATHAYQQVLAVDADDATSAVAMAYRGALLQHMDRFAEARAVLERAVALCTRTGEFRTLLQSLFFCGLARGDVGDLAGALRSLDRARRLIDDAGVGYYRAGIETTTSWLWQELGDLGRAREHAELAVDLARQGGGALELEQGLHALLALADCDLLAGREDDAGALVEAAAPLLDRPLPFRPRAAMRLLEMQARWDPGRADALLDQARTYRSAKYEALALRHLGRDREAAGAAARTRSDLVVAQSGAPGDRVAARERIAAGLPSELRTVFVAKGRLAVPAPTLH